MGSWNDVYEIFKLKIISNIHGVRLSQKSVISTGESTPTWAIEEDRKHLLRVLN
jgi:hypothetical protein